MPKTLTTSPEAIMGMPQDARMKLMRTLSESPTSAVLGALTQATSPQRLPGASTRPSIARPSFDPMKEQARFNQILPRLVAGDRAGPSGGQMVKSPPMLEPEEELNPGLVPQTVAERWSVVHRSVSAVAAFSRTLHPRISNFDPGVATGWRTIEPAFAGVAYSRRPSASARPCVEYSSTP